MRRVNAAAGAHSRNLSFKEMVICKKHMFLPNLGFNRRALSIEQTFWQVSSKGKLNVEADDANKA
jgi:hypothetical protein